MNSNADFNAIRGYRARDHKYDELETAFFKRFVILLKVLMVFAILGIIIQVFDMISNPKHTKNYFIIFTFVWSFCQYLLEFLAYKGKSFLQAKIALGMIAISTAFSVWNLVSLIEGYKRRGTLPDGGAGLYLAFICVSALALLLHFVVCYGAYQLMKILKEKEPKENEA